MSQNVNIEHEMRKSYLEYSLSVIIGRAIPDVRDGLKPVHRRILFAQQELANSYNRPPKKCARIVGDVIGKYHPHGDSAVYDALLQAEGRLTGLRVRQASTGQTLELPLDGVFAAVGRVPGTAPFRAQLELDEEGYFRSGEDCRTRLPGVFVAGDCRAKEVRQLATAVGDGAVAGLAAARFVEDGQG